MSGYLFKTKFTCPYCSANMRFCLGSVYHINNMSEARFGKIRCSNCNNTITVANERKLSTNIVTPLQVL